MRLTFEDRICIFCVGVDEVNSYERRDGSMVVTIDNFDFVRGEKCGLEIWGVASSTGVGTGRSSGRPSALGFSLGKVGVYPVPC